MGKNNVFKTLLSLCQGELSSLIFLRETKQKFSFPVTGQKLCQFWGTKSILLKIREFKFCFRRLFFKVKGRYFQIFGQKNIHC